MDILHTIFDEFHKRRCGVLENSFPQFTFEVVYMYFRDLFAAYLTVKKLGVGRLNCSLV